MTLFYVVAGFVVAAVILRLSVRKPMRVSSQAMSQEWLEEYRGQRTT